MSHLQSADHSSPNLRLNLLIPEDDTPTTVWEYKRPIKLLHSFHHEALPLVERALTLICREGEVVYDGFRGSGTTLLASNKVALTEYLHQFREDLVAIAVWDKGRAQPVMARNVLNGRFEFLLFLTRRRSKGRTLFTADFRGTVSNVYSAPPQQHNPYFALHAAMFPLHLPLWLMQPLTAQREPCSPFLGTGTTLMAEEHLGRTCCGMEIEPAYCDLVLRRWEQGTQRGAARLNTNVQHIEEYPPFPLVSP